MTADEQAALALVAAAEDDDATRLAAHACWLVRPLAQKELMNASAKPSSAAIWLRALPSA